MRLLRRRRLASRAPTRPRSSTARSASASRSSSTAPIGTASADVERARSLIAPFGNGQAYQNYCDLQIPKPLKAYYGANLPRLREVKQAVDPDDRFRPAQGIRGLDRETIVRLCSRMNCAT